MVATKITDLANNQFPDMADMLVMVDVSNHAMSGAGTDVNVLLSDVVYWLMNNFLAKKYLSVQHVPTGTNLTAADIDSGVVFLMTSATDVTFNMPLNATVPISIGAHYKIIQGGVGHISFVPEGGIASYKTSSQGAAVDVLKVDTDAWNLDGALVTV